MQPFNDEEIYPNQPLSDVASEIRFKGEMRVECERHLFWEEIRKEYPDILVPYFEQGQPAALQHYKFRNPDSGRTVAVALNSLVFSEANYSGHKSFIGEFGRLIALFRSVYPELGLISRVGWRYINVIPFSREDGLIPVNRFLRLDVSLPSMLFQRTAALDLHWSGRHFDGEVTIRLAAVVQKDVKQQEAMLLDIDFGKTGPKIEWADVQEVIEDARSKCRAIFENLITDKYRHYLRGETV